MQNRSILSCILLFLLCSCDTTVYIPIPEEPGKPVLNLIMNKDSLMLARVTYTVPPSGFPPFPEAPDAEVRLYENGIFKEILAPYVAGGRTYFRSTVTARSGANYRVTAAIPGYSEAAGSDQVPDTVKTGDLQMFTVPAENGRQRTHISVQLHDDPALRNYYRVRIYRVNEWTNANGQTERQKLREHFETEAASLGLFDDNVRSEFYTEDALYNGRSPRFIFKVTGPDDIKSMIVEISSLTYHSYNYLNSAYLAREKNDDGLSEKVIVYNNIENGLGIVGAVAQREYLLTR